MNGENIIIYSVFYILEMYSLSLFMFLHVIFNRINLDNYKNKIKEGNSVYILEVYPKSLCSYIVY